MRTFALLVAFSLLAAPAFARRSHAKKGPRPGGYCSRSAVGTTSTDSRGLPLECKGDPRGRARWTKK